MHSRFAIWFANHISIHLHMVFSHRTCLVSTKHKPKAGPMRWVTEMRDQLAESNRVKAHDAPAQEKLQTGHPMVGFAHDKSTKKNGHPTSWRVQALRTRAVSSHLGHRALLVITLRPQPLSLHPVESRPLLLRPGKLYRASEHPPKDRPDPFRVPGALGDFACFSRGQVLAVAGRVRVRHS